jgi:trehalose/maltose hydrolase-like predicted phosphorylase
VSEERTASIFSKQSGLLLAGFLFGLLFDREDKGTSVEFYQTTRRYIPENSTFRVYIRQSSSQAQVSDLVSSGKSLQENISEDEDHTTSFVTDCMRYNAVK